MSDDPKKLHAAQLPAELANQKPDPEDPTKIRAIPYPGKFSVASERGVHGHFGGCAVQCFVGEGGFLAEQMNCWARENPWVLIVEVIPSTHGAIVFYTRTLTDEEINEFNEINQEAARLISERRGAEKRLQEDGEEKANALRAETQKKADSELKELRRLADLGRSHEKNCKKERK